MFINNSYLFYINLHFKLKNATSAYSIFIIFQNDFLQQRVVVPFVL